MGEVYRARDPRLGRDVALKVLPEDVSQDPERLARFEREARALAALNHPGIVTIYSVEQSGETRFLTMELVEGESLDTAIAPGGLSLARFFEVAVPLADALSAAHERGIVHRDLKPTNVMITEEGRVKVLDFGLAKLEAPDSDPNVTDMPTASRVELTGEGKVFGTVAYMSPEQARGGKIDARSDVFSLGVVLYQMLTGERPFHGASAVDMISSILRDKPPSVTDLRADLPPHLARILRRCLEKNARDRYQTSRDVYNELRDLQTETSAPPSPVPRKAPTPPPEDSGLVRGEEGFWVAVLPFKYGGSEESLTALAEGLFEEVAAGLSRFRYLSVVGSASAARLKGVEGDERALGAKLGARYVLEGTLRGGGSAIRVSAQLVDAQTGAQLWSQTFQRELQASSVFAVQDDVAARIVATVADSYGVLVHSMRSAIRQKDDADLTPVDWQFQYFAYREQITPATHAELKSRLERAVERDRRQSDLWACLAQLFVDEYAFGFNSDSTSLDRALAAARRAVELDRANQFALVALAQTHFFRQDLAAFGPAAERAMALNPLNTDAVGILGLQIVHTGEFERGAAIVRRAMELNPNHAGWMHFAPLWDHFQKGEYEQALERANRVDVPGLFWPYLVMASACGHLGRRAEAQAAVRDLLGLDPDFAAHARSNVGTWHFASGLMEPILEGLRKAGLSIPGAPETAVVEPGPSRSPTADSGQVRADEGFWVAVLPFKYNGADASLAALAEGLTEEIVTGLSRFSYLKVIARSAAAGGRSAKELGARYVMEGSLRHAGARLRVAVQLVDTVSGAHLWAENYERPFRPESVFELQDELVPRIVSTVADMHGVLPRSMSETVRSRPPEELSPYEAVLRGFGYFERATIEELAAARSGLEAAVRKAPAYSDAWAILSILSTHEYGQRFDLEAGSLTSGSTAARRAVDAAPSSHLAWFSLAQALFFQKEFQSFRNAAERAVALNPMDGDSIATLGGMLTCAGDLERGMALAGRAKQLNPHHPGWYWWVDFCNAYRQGDYRGALGCALKMNLPGHWFMHAAMSAAYGQLGERATAGKALQNLLAIRPDFAATVRMNIEKWWESDFVEHLMDGWVKAGLEIPTENRASSAAKSPARFFTTDSGAARADEGFWVAVLPFKYSGADASLRALAEGLSEEIVTGLSRFSYLRVISRSSAADAQSAGRELGARYVMEGSVRQAGTRLRVAVQLVDAATGAHLWAENFERAFHPEAVFELQDDLVPRIVSTVADMNGILPRSMSDALRSRPPEELSPYEAVLRSFGYLNRVNPEELAAARSGVERAVREAPDYGDAWAMLALLHVQDHAQGFELQPDSLASGLAAARRAVEAAPSNHLAQSSLAQALFFHKEFQSFRNAAERAVALNPMNSDSIAFLGELLTYAGDPERGLALAGRAKQLNPNHSGWYWYADFYDAYRRGDDRAALGFALKINLPGQWAMHAMLAAVYGQLGERDAAARALRELLRLRPDFAATARRDLEKWWEPEYVDRLIEGLAKAGLRIPPEKGTAAPPPDLARSSATDPGAVRADEGFWVAVLPFKSGGGAELTALAEGLTDEIVTGLARFSYLRVISRGSTAHCAAGTDVRAVAHELGARFVMEGNLQQAGAQLRVAVQLVDAATGAHLWAETYTRPFQADQVFAVQDDLVPRIVSTSADHFGVLARTISDAVRRKAVDRLTPYEALMRGFGYHFRLSPEEHAVARDALERAVEDAPANADCWAMLSWVYAHEHAHGFNPRPGSLDRALAAARRAVDLAPSNSLAQQALAVALFFRKETAACLSAAERAIALNPLDGSNEAIFLITFAGGWDRGLSLLRWAMDVNPHHPRWYELILGIHQYRLGCYRAALEEIVKASLPGHFWKSVVLAAAHGQLGELAAAREALRDLLAQKPGFAESGAEFLQKWFDPELVALLLEGLRKAGLDIAAPNPGAEIGPAAAPVSIAVLPFSDMSAAKDQEYLCEGMAEEIMNALVRVGGIRVASRTSAFRARQEAGGLLAIARALSVGHILEGSVRTSGDRLRITAQLTDAASGYQLWSERFDRDARHVFAVQDEIAAGVVEAVKARLAPGKHPVPARPQPASFEAYRCYLKGRHLRGKEDHAGALRAFEEAIRLDPSHAPSWTGLAEVTVLASVFGLIPAREACATAREALATATRLRGESAEGLHVEAFVAWIERRWTAMEAAWRRSIELEPDNVLALASFGIVLCTRQRLDEALPFLERARLADPLASFPYALTGEGLLNCGKPQEALPYLEDALSFEKEDATALDCAGMARVALGRLDEGIATLERVVAVSHRGAHFLGTLGWALATAGRTDEARTILEELRARPLGSPAVVSEAWLLGALAEVDAAFDVVARADEERLAYLYFTGLPGFDPLRDDPRFAALLERLELAEKKVSTAS